MASDVPERTAATWVHVLVDRVETVVAVVTFVPPIPRVTKETVLPASSLSCKAVADAISCLFTISRLPTEVDGFIQPSIVKSPGKSQSAESAYSSDPEPLNDPLALPYFGEDVLIVAPALTEAVFPDVLLSTKVVDPFVPLK